jgi:hypothetical protein
MADFLQSGIEWLASKLKATSSQSVTYQRGGDSVQVSATLGTSDEEVYDESGTSMKARRSDFIVNAEDLILDSEVVTPLSGDQIIFGTRTYEVMALADGHVYEEFPYNLLLRIHAKLVSEE